MLIWGVNWSIRVFRIIMRCPLWRLFKKSQWKWMILVVKWMFIVGIRRVRRISGIGIFVRRMEWMKRLIRRWRAWMEGTLLRCRQRLDMIIRKRSDFLLFYFCYVYICIWLFYLFVSWWNISFLFVLIGGK